MRSRSGPIIRKGYVRHAKSRERRPRGASISGALDKETAPARGIAGAPFALRCWLEGTSTNHKSRDWKIVPLAE
jgi:hypothetical protein